MLIFLSSRLLAAEAGILAMDQAGSKWVAVGDRGKIRLSENQGETWRSVPSPVQSTLTAVTFQGSRRGWAVGHEGVILKTDDGGESWRLLRTDPAADEPLFDVHFDDPQNGLAVGAYGLCLRTEDGGKTWSRRPLPTEDLHLYSVAAPGPHVRVAVGEGGIILRSEDGGRRWRLVKAEGEETLFGVTAGPKGKLVAYGFGGVVWASEDGGRRWMNCGRHGRSLFAGNWASTGLILVGDGVTLFGKDPGSLKGIKVEEGARWVGVWAAGPEDFLVFGAEEIRRISVPR